MDYGHLLHGHNSWNLEYLTPGWSINLDWPGVKCFLDLTRSGLVCYSSVCNRLEPVTGVPGMTFECLLGT